MAERDENGKWIKGGGSPNPGGRPKDMAIVQALARQYTEVAISTLADLCTSAKSESARAAAAEALLNRGWGRPAQAVAFEDGEGNRVAPPEIHMIWVAAKPEPALIEQFGSDDDG